LDLFIFFRIEGDIIDSDGRDIKAQVRLSRAELVDIESGRHIGDVGDNLDRLAGLKLAAYGKAQS
jgi:hypothetical protein